MKILQYVNGRIGLTTIFFGRAYQLAKMNNHSFWFRRAKKKIMRTKGLLSEKQIRETLYHIERMKATVEYDISLAQKAIKYAKMVGYSPDRIAGIHEEINIARMDIQKIERMERVIQLNNKK
ncbi:MAG: hypothetical protein AABX02_02200 [archaeon]